MTTSNLTIPPDERAFELGDVIDIKLAQANAICETTRQARGLHVGRTVADALWIAIDLIEEAHKAFREFQKLTTGVGRDKSTPETH